MFTTLPMKSNITPSSFYNTTIPRKKSKLIKKNKKVINEK